jgi:hypothetical protein
MSGFDWKAVVKTVAPGLASLFGTPLAGAATKFVVDALLPGTPEAQQEEALTAALKAASPETLLKLKEAEQNWKLEMERLGLEEFRLQVADVGDARARQAKMNDWTTPVLAWTYTIGYFTNLAYILTYGVPGNGSHDLILMLEGVMTAAQGSIIQYYFGSSRGSAKKDTWMSNGGNK